MKSERKTFHIIMSSNSEYNSVLNTVTPVLQQQNKNNINEREKKKLKHVNEFLIPLFALYIY